MTKDDIAPIDTDDTCYKCLFDKDMCQCRKPVATGIDNIRELLSFALMDGQIDYFTEEVGKIIANQVKQARVDELKKVAAHNNSEYTSDYIELRIAELEKENV